MMDFVANLLKDKALIIGFDLLLHGVRAEEFTRGVEIRQRV